MTVAERTKSFARDVRESLALHKARNESLSVIDDTVQPSANSSMMLQHTNHKNSIVMAIPKLLSKKPKRNSDTSYRDRDRDERVYSTARDRMAQSMRMDNDDESFGSHSQRKMSMFDYNFNKTVIETQSNAGARNTMHNNQLLNKFIPKKMTATKRNSDNNNSLMDLRKESHNVFKKNSKQLKQDLLELDMSISRRSSKSLYYKEDPNG
jgi:hypothetical protein